MKKTQEAPAAPPFIPGKIAFEIDTTGLALDLVQKLASRLSYTHDCLFHQHEGKSLLFAPESNGPGFGAFAQRIADELKRQMDSFEMVEEKFPRPIHERAQECVRGCLHNLSEGTIGAIKGPHVLDLEVSSTAWRAWLRTRGTGVLNGGTYLTLLERVRGTIRAAIASAYVNPF